VLAIVETMAVSVFIRHDQVLRARTTDSVMRIAMPLIYVAGILVLLVIYAGR